MERLIAGALLGWFFSNPKNQKTLVATVLKGAGFLTDTLNKKSGGDINVVQPVQSKE